MIGSLELAVAFTVALLLFGPEKVPELARQVGELVAEVRNALEDKELKG